MRDDYQVAEGCFGVRLRARVILILSHYCLEVRPMYLESRVFIRFASHLKDVTFTIGFSRRPLLGSILFLNGFSN